MTPVAKGGADTEDNLCLACELCNQYKWTRTHGLDPASGEQVALFNPRQDTWAEHFAWSADGKERGNEALALHQLGAVQAHADLPNVEQAEVYYQQALADELGMRPLVAHCHLGLGRLYAQPGRREQARTALAMAIDLYRAMDMTFWLPQAEAALAQIGQGETPVA